MVGPLRTLGVVLAVLAAIARPLSATPASSPTPLSTPASTPMSTSLSTSPDVARYLNVRSAASPAISPDGTRVAYLSNQSGTAQIWLVAATGGTSRQLTRYDDRVAGAVWSPDGRTLAFAKDTSGNERFQIFLLDVESGAVTDLSRKPDTIFKFGAWSPDGRCIAWASNVRNPAFFDVYVHTVATGETRLVHQADETLGISCWSPDGRKIVLRRAFSNLDNELLLLDLASGATRVLTAHKGEADYASVCWPPGGNTLYLVTNQDTEFSRLAAFDLDGGKLRFIGPDTRWDVDALRVSRDGRVAVWSVNEDGSSRLYVAPLDDLSKARETPLGLGVVTEVSLSDDGARAVLGWTSPRTPSSIALMEGAGHAVKPLVKPGLDGVPVDSLVEPVVVRFPTFDGRQIPAFFYRPRGAGRHPVVISVHGGPEGQERPTWSALYQYFAACGYGVLAPNIRGSVGYGKVYTHLDDVGRRGDAIEDVARAAAWLAAQPEVDGKRLAVMGGSYGGYMTLAQVAFNPTLFAAAVDVVGISNFETFLANTGPWRRKQRMVEYGDPERDLEVLRRFSPIHRVADIRTPLMVIQGAHDPRVPKSEADQMVASLRKLGRPVTYLVFDNEGHGLARLANRIEAYTAVTRFFEIWLREQPQQSPSKGTPR